MVMIGNLILSGLQYLGTPYQFNAYPNQTDTFDCSSFIQTIFRENGLRIPRNSREQYRKGTFVRYKELRPGDLVFFTTKKRKKRNGIEKVGHVALYIGGDHLLHTYKQSGEVTVTKLSGNWLKRYVGARRIELKKDGETGVDTS